MFRISLPAVVVVGLTLSAAAPVFAQDAAPAPAQDAAVPADTAAAPETPVDPVIARGQYLATVGNCISCHTRPGGEPFAGGLAFQTQIGPIRATIHSTNITPDAETGIGSWGEADLIIAMHEGKAPGGRNLFPAFPYVSFTKITDDDVKAIYAYLKTIAPVKYTPPANSFIFSQRWTMSFWNALFFKPGRFEATAGKSDAWNRGAYLVDGLGHCGACHSPRNFAMAEIPSKAYAGGAILDHIAENDDRVRAWSAPNLTPVKGGLTSWTVSDITNYLQKGFSASRAGSFGPMNEVIANSMRHVTDDDAKAIAAYLKDLPPQDVMTAAIPADQATAGEVVYTAHCKECHQASGRGGMFSGPPLAGSAVAQAANPASLINIVLYGPKTPEDEVGTFGSWETMKPYDKSLSDADVAAVANYVRSAWGNVGGPVTAADVAKQR